MYEEEHHLKNKKINNNNKECGALQPFSHSPAESEKIVIS